MIAGCLGAALGVMSVVLGAGQAPVVAGDPAAVAEQDGDAELRFKRGVADLKARRYHQAATVFEALWREGRSTRVLSFAAQAREGAGHWLHAIEHMRALLAEETDMGARVRAQLLGRIAAAQRHAVPMVVRLRVDGEAASDARVTLRRVAPDEVRPLLELPVADGRAFDVDPGVWSFTIAAPGYVPVQRVLAFMARPRRGPVVAEEVVFKLEPITVPTVLELGPAAAVAAGAQWTLTREEEGGGLRMIGGAEAREQLSLEPGRWRAHVEAAGFVAQDISWVAGEAAPPVVTLVAVAPVVAAPTKPPALPRTPDPGRGLGLGLGLAGVASFGVGVGLLVQHRKQYAVFERAPDNAGFVSALIASEVGSGMVGAGLGLAIAGVTAAVPMRRDGVASGVQNSWLWTELGVGGGVAVIGAIWYGAEWKRVQRDLYGQSGAEMPDVTAQHSETAAAAFIGAGVGLAAGAGVALLTRHLVRTVGLRRAGRVGVAGGPGLVGFGVRGVF